MTLFDAEVPYVRRTVTEKPNRYLGQSFGGAPIKAQLDSPESVEAGIDNMQRRTAQEERVYQYLLEWGPATDDQIADGVGLNPNSARPRRIGLVEKGMVEKVGSTTHGRPKSLWGVVK